MAAAVMATCPSRRGRWCRGFLTQRLCSLCTREAWFSKQLTSVYGRKAEGHFSLTISSSAIGGSEARSTSRQSVSGQNARKSKKRPDGVIAYIPVYEGETIHRTMQVGSHFHAQASQPMGSLVGQTLGSPLSTDSFEGQTRVGFQGGADASVEAPPGHLRVIRTTRFSGVDETSGEQAIDDDAASAGPELRKLSPESCSRFVGDSSVVRVREQLARVNKNGRGASDDHYRSRRLLNGNVELEGPRKHMRAVLRELDLIMTRENLVPCQAVDSRSDFPPTRLGERAHGCRQEREIVRNIRAFYNHRRNMQSMRMEIPGWVIAALAKFNMLPFVVHYALHKVVETYSEIWTWYRQPKSSYKATIVMHDHYLCGCSEQGSKQVNCKGSEEGVLVDRGLLAYLRCFSAMQTRNRNLMIMLLAKCQTYQLKYAVSDVCMARIKPGTVMCAYMFSKEEELALSLGADGPMGDNLLRATNRQLGSSIRFMPHRNWREALFYGGVSGWYHHVTGGTLIAGSR